MSEEDLSGLFGSGAENRQSSGNVRGSKDDSFPQSWKKLGRADSDYEDSDDIDPSIRVNMFYPENSSELDTGRGRDDIIEYVWNQLGEEYEAGDVIDLQVHILDELDIEGSLRGKDVFEYVEEFVEEDGNISYIEEIRL